MFQKNRMFNLSFIIISFISFTLSSTLSPAGERWIVNNLEGFTMRIEAADINLNDYDRLSLLAESKVSFEPNPSGYLPGFTVRSGEPFVIHFYQNGSNGVRYRYVPNLQKMTMSYSPEFGLRPFFSFRRITDLGREVAFDFHADCVERIYVDTFAGFKVPFMSPDHLLYCTVPEGRGFIALRIKPRADK